MVCDHYFYPRERIINQNYLFKNISYTPRTICSQMYIYCAVDWYRKYINQDVILDTCINMSIWYIWDALEAKIKLIMMAMSDVWENYCLLWCLIKQKGDSRCYGIQREIILTLKHVKRTNIQYS